MGLELNSDYIKYNRTKQEYYITKEAITNLTTYTSDDLGRVFGSKIDATLQTISHSVYRLIYAARRRENRYSHKKFMRKKIYDNEEEEVTALLYAMIEAVKGAIESGMDLNAYIDDPRETFPFTVKQELEIADLLDPTDKIDNDDLDITYTEAEIDAT